MPDPPSGGVGVVVVNFNTAGSTAVAVGSVLGQPEVLRVLVVDNGSRPDDLAQLRLRLPAQAELLANSCNTGFAAACNQGIARLLENPAIGSILLLNSDAEAASGMVGEMVARLDPHARCDLVAAAVYTADDSRIDSLGIAFYASCIASNRSSERDPLFGPTGGCALYSRRVIEDLISSHGHFFDADYFCYAEDTDVAARALLLGYRPVFAPSAHARHVGQLSSGGTFSSFVLYHGIRNTIWTAVKDVPGRLLLARLPWIVLLHGGIVVRHLRRGEARTLFRLYRDALLGLPRMLARRTRIQRARRIGPREFAAFVSPKFYDRGFVRDAWRQLFRPEAPEARRDR
jgi:GT2 family glycosyltransferase